MLGVKIDRADPTDLYEQVGAEIRRAIADGEAKTSRATIAFLAPVFRNDV